MIKECRECSESDKCKRSGREQIECAAQHEALSSIKQHMCCHPATSLSAYNMHAENEIVRTGSSDGIMHDLSVTRMHFVMNCICKACNRKFDIETIGEEVEHGDWSKLQPGTLSENVRGS